MTTPLHCLIIEDSEDDAQLLVAELRGGGFDVTWERVFTPDSTRAALARAPWDIVLSDYRMPQFSGLDALALVRACDVPPPFILVSGTIGEEIAVSAMRAGASDYLMKDNLARLVPAVQRELRDSAGRAARRKADAAQLASEKLFRTFFEQANVGMSITQLSGAIAPNRAICDMLGYSREELSHRNWQDITHPEDVEPTQTAIDALVTGQQDSSRLTKRFIHKDGTVRWGDLSYTLLRDPAGLPLHIVSVVVDITERKADEAALERLRVLHAETERIGKVGGWELDLGTGRGIWTDEVRRIHEVDPAFQPSLEASIDFYTPESRPIITEAVRRALEHGESFDLDLDIITVLGNRKAVHVIGMADLDRRKVFGFFQDITERKRGEEAMRISEHQLRSYFEGAGDAIYIVEGATGRILQCNSRASRDLGYSQEELLGMRASDIECETPHSDIQAVLTELAPDAIRTVMGMHRRKDGSVFPVEMRLAPLGPSQPGCILSVARDVTARAQQEAALRESESRFRILSENALTGVYIVAGGVLTYVNPCFARIFGYRTDQLIGMDPLTIIHPDDRELVRENMRRRLEGEVKSLNYEFKGLCSNGDVKAIEVLGVGIVLNDRPALIGNILDISERRQAEVEQARLRDELTQSQKLESIGHLAGGVAHDFNNMLAAIIGYAELTMQKLGPAHEVYPYADAIRTAGQRSADLTGRLLAFARKQQIAPVVLTLNDAVASILKMLDRLLGERVRVVWLPGSALWRIEADPTHIDQVLTNLAVNARDAMGGVDGQLEIATSNVALDSAFAAAHPGAHAGEYVELRMSDKGCGMSQETLSHVFEPFFTTKAPGEGTGMGLASVFGIMAQHGGFVVVESTVGVGSTFRCFFPRTDKPAVSVPSTRDTPPRGAETILLVEDEESVRDSTAALLRSLGYTVLPASDGAAAQAIAAGRIEPIHLLLTDVIMPGMNGAQVRDALLAQHADLRVLFMSGYAGNVISAQGALGRGTYFIQKPFTLRALAVAVRTALDGRPPTGSGEPGV